MGHTWRGVYASTRKNVHQPWPLALKCVHMYIALVGGRSSAEHAVVGVSGRPRERPQLAGGRAAPYRFTEYNILTSRGLMR